MAKSDSWVWSARKYLIMALEKDDLKSVKNFALEAKLHLDKYFGE